MRVIQSNNIIFGKLLNFTQYFAEIGGFDALIAALKIGSDNQLSSSSDNSK